MSTNQGFLVNVRSRVIDLYEMPNALKVTALSPSLKKPDADFKQFSNFRPISNLTLVSKIIEKAVAEQLTDHVKTFHLDEMYQSAFKVLHSTETALLYS